jgi:iron complex outermembrane recepter protein
MIRHRTAAGALLGLAATGLATGSAAAEDSQLEEIVVTARKVAEPNWTVPLTINVLKRDEMIAASVADLSALARMAPGLYFESLWGGAGSAPVLRGQSQPSAAGDNVGVFVGGVYQAEHTAVDVPPLDLERIEVVHGPQSTLFGHSTFTGAIHYVPRAPTADFTTGFELGAGTHQYWDASGYLSGPLAQGAVLGRFAAGLRNAAGTWTNSADGDSLGDVSRDAVAASFTSDSSGPWSATLAGRWSKTGASLPAQTFVGGADYNCGAIDPASGYWSYYCGSLPVSGHVDLSTGVPDSSNQVGQASISIRWSSADLTFESDTSYYRGVSDIYRDFDSTSGGETFGVCAVSVTCPPAAAQPTPVNRLVQVNTVSRQSPATTEWSQEFRMLGQYGPALDWLLGLTGFLTDQESTGRLGFDRSSLVSGEALTVLLPVTPGLVGPLARANLALVDDPNRQQRLQSRAQTTVSTLAAFGAVTYRPVDRVALRAEFRTTWERQKLDSVTSNFQPSFGKSVPAQSFTDTTPRFSIDYAPNSDLFLYASAAKGSRSGGINPAPDLIPEEQTYDPEYNWTYELSGRYRDPQRRYTGSVTLYHIDWYDTQINGYSNTPGVTTFITGNTAGMRTNGVELVGEAKLSSFLTLEGAYSYAHPEFVAGSDDPGSNVFCGLRGGNHSSTFCKVGPARSGAAPTGAYVPYIDGNTPQRAPTTQWQVGMRGDSRQFDSGWRFSGAADLSYQSDVYDRPIDGARFGERTLLSARAAVLRGPWTIELWGTNLTDEHYIRAVSSRGAAFYQVSPRPLDLVYGDGRRVGLTLSYNQ